MLSSTGRSLRTRQGLTGNYDLALKKPAVLSFLDQFNQLRRLAGLDLHAPNRRAWAKLPGLPETTSTPYAPWRKADTYRETWPHEYVLLLKDGQRQLFEAVCRRMRNGEAFEGSFLGRRLSYLFIGDYKYWFMTPYNEIDLDAKETDYVLNRVNLYRNRRDFHIRQGDRGRRENYPDSLQSASGASDTQRPQPECLDTEV